MYNFITKTAAICATLVQTSTTERAHRYGNVNLYNHCPMALYIEGYQGSGLPYLRTTLQPLANISMPMRESFNGAGNSIKVATSQGSLDILQIEYSACFEPKSTCGPAEQTYYDISKIDGDPLLDQGTAIIPSFPDCPKIECAAGDHHCPNVYYQPLDNWAVRECDSKSNLNVYFGGIR